MKMSKASGSVLADSVRQSFAKLSPVVQVGNPVMFVVYLGAALTTALWALSFAGIADESGGYTLAIALILWFTVLFANFAEAIAEGRGRAQADSLRKARRDVLARRLRDPRDTTAFDEIDSARLKKDDVVFVKAGE